MSSQNPNIASHLKAAAKEDPEGLSVVAWTKGEWRHLTYAELDQESDAYARGLSRAGIGRGTRTVLMVRPSLEFFSLVFALFKMGAVVVLIDPGIGKRSLLRCLEEIDAEAFIGVPAAQVARLLFPRPFRNLKTNVTVGKRIFWGGETLESIRDPGPFEMVETGEDEVAAILFTSGSTGIPKGALYTHGIFDAQIRIIGELYGIERGDVDLSTFPPFALFGPAMGMTSVIPDMDARHPAKADPVKLAHAIISQGATSMFGSPALLDNLSRWAVAHGMVFSTLKRVLCAGAPVRFDILERMSRCLPEGVEVFTPFGATEALPVASIGSREVFEDTHEKTKEGMGICVGRPVPGVKVRVIRISDEPIESWSDDLLVEDGVVGEITVKGPVVTRGYWAREDQTRLAKIDEDGEIVHRMGDLGWVDEKGRIWMCGRKSQRVETSQGPLFTIPAEQVFNQHPAVHRSALVGLGPKGNQTPVLVVEKEAGVKIRGDVLVAELLALGEKYPSSKSIRHVLIHPGSFPVDIRHNAKIHRDTLAEWARKTWRG